LLKALRNYHAGKSVRSRLLTLIEEIELLYKKGLIKAMFLRLEKGKQLAFRYEQFNLYILLARMELQYLTELEFPHVDEAGLVARQEKINDLLLHQLLINKHSALYEILLHRYFHRGPTRSTRDNQRLNDLLLEEHQVSTNKRFNSFESAKLHLLFQSTYFLMIGQYEESVSLFSQLKILFDQHSDLWEEEPVYYTHLISGILTGLRSMGRHEDMRTFIERLHQINIHTPNQHLQITQITLSHQLSILIDSGRFEQGLALWNEYEATHPLTVFHSASGALICCQAAIIHFGLNNYANALRYINAALNTPGDYLPQTQYSLFRMLNLLIHFELGNHDYLDYEVRSVERVLSIRKKLYKSEKALLQFFRRYLKAHPRPDLLQALHKQMQTLAHDPYEKALLLSFDFNSWAEAKIHKMSFSQLVRQKAQHISDSYIYN
jgi:tetratricopeptide (TPR) repeat protein